MTPLLADPPAASKPLMFDTPQRQEKLDPDHPQRWGFNELSMAIFISFGYLFSFMSRGSLSIVRAEMISMETSSKKSEFHLGPPTTGWIISLFLSGSLFGVIGAYVCSKNDTSRVAGLGVLINGLLSMSSPTTISISRHAFVMGRLATGVFQNFADPAIANVTNQWISNKGCFSRYGYYVSAAVIFPICGFIAKYFGWPMIFHFTGFTAAVWSLLLLKYVPRDKNILEKELKYIRGATESGDLENVTYSWKKIMTSKTIWILSLNKFAIRWTNFTLLFFLPLYIRDLTNESTATVGLLSGIPNYINLFAAPMTGLFLDYLMNHHGFNKSKLQKYILAMGLLFGGFILVAIGLSNFLMSMTGFTLVVILHSMNLNILQITSAHIPNHAGFMFLFEGQWYSLSSVLASLALNLLVNNHTWPDWRIWFGLSGGISILAALATISFGCCGDEQLPTEDRIRIYEYDQVTIFQE